MITKYRIIPYGKNKVAVQYKLHWFSFWTYYGDLDYYAQTGDLDFNSIETFESEEEAERIINRCIKRGSHLFGSEYERFINDRIHSTRNVPPFKYLIGERKILKAFNIAGKEISEKHIDVTDKTVTEINAIRDKIYDPDLIYYLIKE